MLVHAGTPTVMESEDCDGPKFEPVTVITVPVVGPFVGKI